MRGPNDATARSPGRWSTFMTVVCRHLLHWTHRERTPFLTHVLEVHRLDWVTETRTGHSSDSRSRLDLVPRPLERLHDCLCLSHRNESVNALSTVADVLREGTSDHGSNRCLLSTNGHETPHCEGCNPSSILPAPLRALTTGGAVRGLELIQSRDGHLLVPTARGHIRGQLVVIRALKAAPPSAGQCRPTLLIAREIAGHWSDHPIPKVSCAPLIAGQRLCRSVMDFAEQRSSEHEKQSGCQAHGSSRVARRSPCLVERR